MNDFLPYILHLADNALVLGHRNSEWTGHGPILEQDIALSNIALDLIGQARYLYQYAAALTGGNASEDSLAYFRCAKEYENCLLVEQENGDWGKTILRQFFFSAYQLPLYDQLLNWPNEQLAAIAEKSIKEVAYHLRWSSEWVIRLGCGTAESHTRMINAIDNLWKYTGELLTMVSYENNLPAPVNIIDLKAAWNKRVNDVLLQAGMNVPENVLMQYGGKEGIHTVHLEKLLGEMQYMQRTYPGHGMVI